ncbi:MAG TPA: hypothetical protein VFA43_19890 [Gemmatimonadaceae bacterium]|nr:hypothetical protein [Gemmatimonadaceae bacterium]
MQKTLALFLLGGTVFLGTGSLLHPMLMGDAAAELTKIAASSHFRAIHLAMLAGSALIMTGVWVRALDCEPGEGVRFGIAFALIDLGLALNAYDIAFMARAGTRLAAAYATGDGTSAPMFDAMHDVGLMYAKFGNFIVALGALALGAAERPTRRTSAMLAWIAAAGGLVGLGSPETSLLILAPVALLFAWQVVTGLAALDILHL